MSISPKYKWRDDELRALAERGLKLGTRGGYDRFNRVQPCYTREHTSVQAVAKAVQKGSSEAVVLQRLLDLSCSVSNVIPTEIVECEHSTLLIMPFLRSVRTAYPNSLSMEQYLQLFTQMIDSLSDMHERNIAFIDIDTDNMVWSEKAFSFNSCDIKAGSLFYIDFGSARQLPAGPGSGVTLADGRVLGGHFKPPEGEEDLDPYAYDIYCLGGTLKSICQNVQNMAPQMGWSIHFPLSLHCFIDVLHNSDPAQRPPIRLAKRLWSELRNWITVMKEIPTRTPAQTDAIDMKMWQTVSGRFL
ncbi:hypothetical protein EIP91_004976 [Steccherinum ochraceum]|uniref:Protein kinase domain-containing protein n=1 Tax=Steccherinum ochraceum TaxID=92696 RepID=A0A4R0R7V1_9APHY|nr:hypothetical protein EIP91_004976 [Steccherinum ochraceum]